MAIGFIKFIVFLSVLLFGVWFTLQRKTTTVGTRTTTSVGVSIPNMIFSLVLLAITILVFPSIGYVPAGSTGVVLRFGAVTGRILQPGIYTVIPIVESVREMDVQIQAEKAVAKASSKDLQEVTTEVTLNYAPMPEKTATIYQTLGMDYVRRIIDPSIQEAVKATTAKFDAESLITQRPAVRDSLENFLSERLATHGIKIDALSITDFSFSKEFNDSIELKVTAVQKALTAENKLKQSEAEANQRIAQAKGEAEAIRIQAEAIAKQGGDSYVALKWIEKWNGSPPQFMSGNDKPNLLFQVPNNGR